LIPEEKIKNKNLIFEKKKKKKKKMGKELEWRKQNKINTKIRDLCIKKKLLNKKIGLNPKKKI